jgi:hypothetical protein
LIFTIFADISIVLAATTGGSASVLMVQEQQMQLVDFQDSFR